MSQNYWDILNNAINMIQHEKTSLYKKAIKSVGIILMIMCCMNSLVAQVEARVDTTSIRIGEELTFTLEIEVDTTTAVIFPEGQSFLPLEVLESYSTDTTKNDLKMKLIKKYGLTQFDSGIYIIPKQKILINETVLFSDSIAIKVNSVKLDTANQKLYDIKPVIQVEKRSTGWKWLWWAFGFIMLVLLLLYKFVWGKNLNINTQKLPNLPPYEQAKTALKDLDEKQYFVNHKIKSFYSELTFILRRYLDEKVYSQSLESTTDELLEALRGLRNNKIISLNDDSLKNIESILRRADLVKFAKSEPAFETIRYDKNIIDIELDQVKKGLPEPTEEELKKDLEFHKNILKKKQQQRLKIAGISALGLLFLAFFGSSFYFGFTTVKDTLLRHPSKLLLETEHWIVSEYGAPGITIETPEVLERKPLDSLGLSDQKMNTKTFEFIKKNVPLRILLKSSKFNTNSSENETQRSPVDLLNSAEEEITKLGQLGALNLLPKNEQFITTNGQEGLKTYGNALFPFNKNETVAAEFVILGFSTPNFLQQLILVWALDDPYAKQISDRILNSVELIKLTQE